jgi:dTMP kinase
LALRVIESNGMNYWESGMDLKLGADLYDSFKKYQGLLIKEFDKMAEEFHFEVIDARKPPQEIQEALRIKLHPILKNEREPLAATQDGITIHDSSSDPPINQ